MLDSLSLIVNQRLVRKRSGGRTGVFECLSMTDEIRQLILSGKDIFSIQHILKGSIIC
jgi:Tfp pilus assembly pilus retraction ATPase PilT